MQSSHLYSLGNGRFHAIVDDLPTVERRVADDDRSVNDVASAFVMFYTSSANPNSSYSVTGYSCTLSDAYFYPAMGKRVRYFRFQDSALPAIIQ